MGTGIHPWGCWEGLWLTGGLYLKHSQGSHCTQNETPILTRSPWPSHSALLVLDRPGLGTPETCSHSQQLSPFHSRYGLKDHLLRHSVPSWPLSQVHSQCQGYGTGLFLSLTDAICMSGGPKYPLAPWPHSHGFIQKEQVFRDQGEYPIGWQEELRLTPCLLRILWLIQQRLT